MKPVALYLAREERHPDLALVSPAERTRETWALAESKLDDVAVSFEKRIYEAPPEQLLKVLQEADGVVADGPLESLILVGHNPGISELGQMLVRDGPSEARAALAQGLPTAGVAVIDFDIQAWHDIAAQTGTLVDVVSPASLEKA